MSYVLGSTTKLSLNVETILVYQIKGHNNQLVTFINNTTNLLVGLTTISINVIVEDGITTFEYIINTN